jgi:zinc and cadmium transporter
MGNFIWAIGASIAVSLVSLIGILGLLLKENILNKILILLVGFSAGGLMGGAFLHLLPEALVHFDDKTVFIYVIIGFILFFILEKYLYWRHCHDGVCDAHAFTYLNLIGDSIHNLSDGLIIGASFLVGINFGIITTLIILFHEIPQEIGDFGVLIYGGIAKLKALLYNFISALTCILGTAIGYNLSMAAREFSCYLLPLVSGGFIYIAACDLIPEMHKQQGVKRATFSVISFCCGILFIWLAGKLRGH